MAGWHGSGEQRVLSPKPMQVFEGFARCLVMNGKVRTFCHVVCSDIKSAAS